jgi:hypothetical protein
MNGKSRFPAYACRRLQAITDCDAGAGMHDFAAFQTCCTETVPVGDDNVGIDDFDEITLAMSGPQ